MSKASRTKKRTNSRRIAMYPGSFDPWTRGHQDILDRALQVFDEVRVVVAETPRKTTLFSTEERVDILRRFYKGQKRVVVDSWDGLTVEYARRHHIGVIIRGLRAASDFEYEFMMASMNKSLNSDVETFFMMTAQHLFFVSSSMIKELARFSSELESYVHPRIARAIQEKMKKTKRGA